MACIRSLHGKSPPAFAFDWDSEFIVFGQTGCGGGSEDLGHGVIWHLFSDNVGDDEDAVGSN